jgi:hypothetical protein
LTGQLRPIIINAFSSENHKFGEGGGWMTLSEEDRRLIGFWAAHRAERVLPVLEAIAPSDTRSPEAIEDIRTFTEGGAYFILKTCTPDRSKLFRLHGQRLWP